MNGVAAQDTAPDAALLGNPLHDRLEALRKEGVVPADVFRTLDTDEAQAEFARAHTIHPAWFATMSWLEQMAEGASLRLAAVTTIGIDQPAVFHAWVAAMLRDPAYGLVGHVVDDEAGARCEQVAALHARAASGTMVGRKLWRQARSALSHIDQGSFQGRVIKVVAATCWDVSTVPTLFQDIQAEWNRLVAAMVDAERGWDADTEQSRDMAGWQAAGEAAAGPRPDPVEEGWDETLEGKAWIARFYAGGEAFSRSPPAGYFERSKAVGAAQHQLVNTLLNGAVRTIEQASSH